MTRGETKKPSQRTLRRKNIPYIVGVEDGRTVDGNDLVGAVDLLKKGRQRLPLTNVGNGPAKGQVKQFSFPEKGRMSQVIEFFRFHSIEFTQFSYGKVSSFKTDEKPKKWAESSNAQVANKVVA